MTIKQIKKQLNTIKKNKLREIALVIFALFIISIIPVYAQEETYNSNIKLNTTSTNLLIITDKKVEAISGISKSDMDNLNSNPNPELIKAYMQTIAPEYGVDWKLVYAIGYHESANYSSSLAKNNNNYFGRKASSGGYASWATPEEGVRDQFEYLKTRYFDRGLTTPESINRVYAEDMSWNIKIKAVMAGL